MLLLLFTALWFVAVYGQSTPPALSDCVVYGSLRVVNFSSPYLPVAPNSQPTIECSSLSFNQSVCDASLYAQCLAQAVDSTGAPVWLCFVLNGRGQPCDVTSQNGFGVVCDPCVPTGQAGGNRGVLLPTCKLRFSADGCWGSARVAGPSSNATDASTASPAPGQTTTAAPAGRGGGGAGGDIALIIGIVILICCIGCIGGCVYKFCCKKDEEEEERKKAAAAQNKVPTNHPSGPHSHQQHQQMYPIAGGAGGGVVMGTAMGQQPTTHQQQQHWVGGVQSPQSPHVVGTAWGSQRDVRHPSNRSANSAAAGPACRSD